MSFLHFFKKKTIYLDAFIDNKLIFDLFPIKKSVYYVPTWWKQLDKTYGSKMFERSTMKLCDGILDYFKKSFTIPLWCDFKLDVYDSRTYNWVFSDGVSNADAHDMEQRKNFLENYGHLKLNSPWIINSKEFVQFFVSQPTWNFTSNPDVIFPPAILDFKYQQTTNVNLFFPANEKKIYEFSAGQPLITLTPLTEHNVVIVNHVISSEEFKSKQNHSNRFTFYNYLKKKKQFLNKSECPFK